MTEEAVVMAVVVDHSRLLMIRRSIIEGDLVWALPGGKVEPGETVEQTAARETREETGLVVQALRQLGNRTHPDTGRRIVYVACQVLNGQAYPRSPREVAAVAWVSPEQLPRYAPRGLYGPVHAYVAAGGEGGV